MGGGVNSPKGIGRGGVPYTPHLPFPALADENAPCGPLTPGFPVSMDGTELLPRVGVNSFPLPAPP